MSKDNKKLGETGEKLAEAYLVSRGYRILERNWRYSRSELDLIAMQGGILIFVEVKTKNSDAVRPPEANVTRAKQRRIVDAANRYMEAVGYDGEIRFDVVSIVMHGNAGHTLTHFPDAFFPGMHP